MNQKLNKEGWDVFYSKHTSLENSLKELHNDIVSRGNDIYYVQLILKIKHELDLIKNIPYNSKLKNDSARLPTE